MNTKECEKAKKRANIGDILALIGHALIVVWLLWVFGVIPMASEGGWAILSIGGLLSIIGVVTLYMRRKACDL